MWSEDGIYVLPGGAILHGKAAIDAMLQGAVSRMPTTGVCPEGDVTLTLRCDPTAIDPHQVAITRERAMTIDGRTTILAAIGSAVKEKGEWKFSMIGVHATSAVERSQ